MTVGGDGSRARIYNRLLQGLLVVLLILPSLLVAAYTYHHARNVPVADQWLSSTRVAIAAIEGNLSLKDLFRQHQEHRPVFTHAVTAVMTWTTNWNIRREAFLTVGLAGVVVLLLASILFHGPRPASAWAMVPVVWLVFSVRQRVTWLMSFENQYYFMLLFFVLAIALVHRRPRSWSTVLVAALFCLCSTFSLGTGLLSWPLIGLQLLLRGYRKIWHFAVFGIAGVAGVVTFFAGLRFIERETELKPMHFIGYTLAFLGNPFVDSNPSGLWLAMVVGALGLLVLALCVFLLWRRGLIDRYVSVWLIPAALPVAVALLAAKSRSFVGMHQALRSRYVTFSSLLWVALAVLVFKVLTVNREGASQVRIPSAIRFFLLAFSLGCAVLYGTANWRAAGKPPLATAIHQRCLMQPKVDLMCIRTLHTGFKPAYDDSGFRRALLRNIRLLRKHRLTLYASLPG